MISTCRPNFPCYLLTMAILSACAPAVSDGPTPSASVASDPRVAWLAAHAIPLRSISPADTGFADLQPLKQVIGDARIVMLGEASHGDGAGILARTRLIRFLHQEMGFDVLAFESSMYNCAAGDRMLQTGSDALTAVQACAYRIWSAAQEIVPLAEYLSGAAQTPRPLHLAGFDNQFDFTRPEHPPQPFITELRAFLSSTGQADAWPAHDPGFEPLLLNVLSGAYWTDTTLGQPDSAVYEDFVATLEQMSLRIQSTVAEAERSQRPGASDPNWMKSSRWVRLLEGLAVFARQQPWTQGNDADEWAAVNRRDRQMARNLLWLLEGPFAGRKLILWGHNGHFMRNLRQLDAADGSFNYRDEGAMVPMGQHLWEALGEDAYMLAITAYEGSAAPPFAASDVAAFNIPDIARDQDPSLELEELLAATGIESGVVDLRRLSREHWLRRALVARPMEYTAMRAEDWGESVDGFLFIRTMTPATPLQR
jgi:erythromycin esterase